MNYVVQLAGLLDESVKQTVEKEKIAVAFSGGLDSSLLALIAKKYSIIQLYVCGTENCKDFISAETAAGLLKLNLKKIILSEKDIEEGARTLSNIFYSSGYMHKAKDKGKPESFPISTWHFPKCAWEELQNDFQTAEKTYASEGNNVDKKSLPFAISSYFQSVKISPEGNNVDEGNKKYIRNISVTFNLPLFFAAKECKEKIILSGQGPDTMLGGFSKHLELGKKELKKELIKDTEELVNFGKAQHEAIGKYFRKEVKLPYLSEKVVEFAKKIPVKFKIKEGTKKYILVEAAKILGLPAEIAERKKRSAQYGSGVMKAIKRLAKKRGMSVGEWLEDMKK